MLKASKNIQKLQSNIEKGLHDIVSVEGNNEASAAAFFLLANVLNDSGNFDYAEKYYQKAQELSKQDGEADYVSDARLIKINASQGRADLVMQKLESLQSDYDNIDHKPAIAKEIKAAFKESYDVKLKGIPLNKVLENAIQNLVDNPDAQAPQNVIKISNIVKLDDDIKKALDDILTKEPSELAQILSSPVSLQSYLDNMFSTMNNRVSQLETKTESKLSKLEEDISKKPSTEDLENLAQKTGSQIKEVYAHNQEEATRLQDMITRVEANAATQEDVMYINEQLENTDSKTQEGAEQLIVLRSMYYNIENKNSQLALDITDISTTVETKTQELAANIADKTKEIHDILKTKANQDDLEYVNEELEGISSGRYDDTQKIKLLDQLVSNVNTKVDLQEKTITEFKTHVEDGFNTHKSDLENLSNNFNNIELSNISTEDINKLMSGAETNSKLINELSRDVRKIDEVIDPSIKEFMANYEDQRVALDNITRITNEYQRYTSISNEEIASKINTEIEKVKAEFGEDITSINDALTRTEIYKKADVSRQFDSLSKDEEAYAQSFATNLYSYLNIFDLAKHGLFDISKESLTPGWASDVLKAIPAIGNTLDVINTYANKVYGAKDLMTKEQKVKKINEIMTQHFTVNDLKLYTQEVSLAFVKTKDVQDILNKSTDDQDPSISEQYQELKAGLNHNIDLLKGKLVGVDAVDMDFSQLSAKSIAHVGAFVEVLCSLDEQEGKSFLPRDESLGVFIQEQVLSSADSHEQDQNTQDQFEEAKASEIEENQINSSESNCNIFAMTGIEYDNDLLNNPALLKDVLAQYSISEILDLSVGLDSGLTNTATETADSQLLLAGIISVDQGSDLI